MASLKELEDTLPDYYTLSNNKLIIIARVREESVYFFDVIDRNTTIILLAEPECYRLKHIFLEFVTGIGASVIDLREKETFDASYTISKRSKEIIQSIIMDNNYSQIITHPAYKREDDSQNREIFDYVKHLVNVKGTNNHYTYVRNTNTNNTKPKLSNDTYRDKFKNNLFNLYCRIASDDEKLDTKMYENYQMISSSIIGIRKVY